MTDITAQEERVAVAIQVSRGGTRMSDYLDSARAAIAAMAEPEDPWSEWFDAPGYNPVPWAEAGQYGIKFDDESGHDIAPDDPDSYDWGMEECLPKSFRYLKSAAPAGFVWPPVGVVESAATSCAVGTETKPHEFGVGEYKTRGGYTAEVLKATGTKLIGCIVDCGNIPTSWAPDGVYLNGYQTRFDLLPHAPVKRRVTGWLSVFKDGQVLYTSGLPYLPNSDTSQFAACLPIDIEYEEGEGL